MKILPINTLNFNIHKNEKNNSHKSSFIGNYGFDYSLSETLGRSQVSFDGNDGFEFSEKDKYFIKAVSRDIRLDEDEQEKLRGLLKDYLENNSIKSLGDINTSGVGPIMSASDFKISGYLVESDDDVPAGGLDFVNFSNDISSKMGFNDQEKDIFYKHVLNRVLNSNNYAPKDYRYDKDIPLIKNAFKPYGELSILLIDTMMTEAGENGYSTLFEIFEQENKPAESKTYGQMVETYGHDIANDILIDLNSDSTKKEIERRDKAQRLYVESLKRVFGDIANSFISDAIMNEYGDSVNKDALEQCLEQRHRNVPINIVALEVAEMYNFPNGEIPNIIKIISDHDAHLDNL